MNLEKLYLTLLNNMNYIIEGAYVNENKETAVIMKLVLENHYHV